MMPENPRPAGLPARFTRPRSMNPKLILASGKANESEIPIRLPFSIGRLPTMTLVITHPSVSRHHCDIVRRDDYLWVHDHGSSNGTFVNGQQVQAKSVMKPGDRITIGPLTFIVEYVQRGLRSQRQLSKQRAAEASRPDAGTTPAPASQQRRPSLLEDTGEQDREATQVMPMKQPRKNTKC